MPTKLEKILNLWVLLFINIAIILAAELTGLLFVETGIIHFVAVIFMVLGISRIFVHYDAYDRYLHLLIHGGAAALVIFAASHLVEFLGYLYFKMYEDIIFVNVINFYVISMFAVAIGAEYFLHKLKKNSVFMSGVLIAGIIAIIFLTMVILLGEMQVSLEPDEAAMYGYAILVAVAGFLSISRLVKIKGHVSIMAGFANYFIAAFVLISLSSFQYVFYELLEEMGLSEIQTVYIGHFLFYGALSLMFLAFVHLTNLGGVYQEAEKYRNNSAGKF